MSKKISPKDAAWPVVFLSSLSVAIWKMPALLSAIRDGAESSATISALTASVALIFLLVSIVIGTITVRPIFDEIPPQNIFDRFSMFISRPSLLLIVVLVAVMIYEVILRYAFGAPTIWANEMTVWLAAAIFLLSGPYVQQQRAHISVDIVHQAVPRWLSRCFDIVSTALLVLFAVAIVWGGYAEAMGKFVNWETLGTIFDPPVPATLKPLILVMVVVTAIQGIANLVSDWNKVVNHDAVDPSEIEGIKASLAKYGMAEKGQSHV
ncbi:TRAP-type mannitol/chloroaromatic compound transport system, small permease component [Paracoccus saliphilus]|nr:TRAP-type mannitol/chloroaromatic compound transport system, small permease component [Paracoccus saliphilus]